MSEPPPLTEVETLKAALYTACAQLAWHNDMRGNVAWIRANANRLLLFVNEPEERDQSRVKIGRLNQS